MKCIMAQSAALLLAAAAVFANPVAFEMGTAADKDIVYESAKGAKALPFGDKTDGDQTFVENNHGDGNVTAQGLPSNRKIASGHAELGSYHLLPYNGKNVIELGAHGSTPAESHRISVPKHAYKLIGILAASVHGDSSYTIKLHYADGSETVVWWEADDWFEEADQLRASQKPVITKMDRVRAKDGTIDKAGHYSLFEFIVVPDSKKILDAITIGNDPNRWPDDAERWGAVFAISGATAD